MVVLARQGQRQHRWTPAELPNLKGWWVADDVAGADGASIANWASRITGQTLTQATGGKQPVLKKAANGINGRNVLRFTAANSSSLSVAPGSIPNAAPFTIIYVIRQTTTTGTQGHVTLFTAGGTGFYCRMIGGGARLFTSAAGEATGYGMLTSPQIITWQHDGSNFLHTAENVLPITGALGSPSGGTTLTFGSAEPAAGDYLDGDLAEVIITSDSITAAQRLSVHDYLNRRYAIDCGRGNNAANFVTTPTDVATNGTCVETSIVKPAVAWNGYAYWQSFVGLNTGVANENPNVAASNDGDTWVTPAGCPVPVIVKPATGNNADPCIYDNTAVDGKMYVFYKVENNGTDQGTWFTSSSDGSTWSARAKVIAGTNNDDTNEPKVVFDSASGQFWMYHIDLSVTPRLWTRRTSSSLTSGYSARTVCTFDRPMPSLNGRGIWHAGNVIKVGGKWVVAFSSEQTDPNFPSTQWLASSVDGLAWKLADHPILAVIASTSWDRDGLYRLTLLNAGDGLNLHGWYSTYARFGGTTTQHLSQRITISRSEIP